MTRMLSSEVVSWTAQEALLDESHLSVEEGEPAAEDAVQLDHRSAAFARLVWSRNGSICRHL